MKSQIARDAGTPTILLINDDGIQSLGLLALKKQLEKLGRLVVVAPKDERSGIGKALSTNHIKLAETQLRDGSEAIAVSGTPADAFLIAKYKILRRPPDLLVSGINIGPNLGIDDLFTSGTLGAALEAAVHRVPSIAVSYCTEELAEQQDKSGKATLEELEFTAVLAQKVAKYVLKHGIPPDVDILSINVPEKIGSKQIKITRLSYKEYQDIYTRQGDGYKIIGWALRDYLDDEKGTDLYVVKKEKCVSITPVKINLTHRTESLNGLLKALNSDLEGN
ncbi:MAG: 5'/3'-nucleotidase SurE [Thermoproteota archaeon]|nr:5'/3'-nucleotidase SurE [Thermoproteota archaeon]